VLIRLRKQITVRKINTLILHFQYPRRKSLTHDTAMALKVFLFLLFSGPFFAVGQKLTYKGFPSSTWPLLYDIRYDESAADFAKPIFNSKVHALQGKQIALPGYLVPFESGLKSNVFMLSSLPLNACFFCGVGGPETVVQIICAKPVEYTDKPVEIQGILRLNDSDPGKMIYILENAEYLGELDF
jgi:hypothetical protein